MPITSLNSLEKNSVFIELNRQQSELDSQDAQTLDDDFTRSPLHAIQFLIAYAGLNEQQRIQVIAQLNNRLITKDRADALIIDIDWEAVLKEAPTDALVTFKAQLQFPNKDIFLNAIKTEGNLFAALMYANSIVTIGDGDSSSIVFITTVSEKALWVTPFFEEKNSPVSSDTYWRVPVFELSPLLKSLVASLSPNRSKVVGCFNIQKGTSDEIKLYLPKPSGSGLFHKESAHDVHAGIYNAFLNLEQVFGLDVVDEVKVKLKNEAEFSKVGACATQTQECRFERKSAKVQTYTPTIITLNSLNVFFHEVGIVATFTEKEKKKSYKRFNPLMYIEFPTKNPRETHVALLAQALKPADAFLLTTHASISEEGMFEINDPAPAVSLGTAREALFSQREVRSAQDISASLRDSCAIS